MMFNNYSMSQRLSLNSSDVRRDHSAGSSRMLSPIAFFHDGITTNDINLRYNTLVAQRRAQAIATAPRRNRYDDDDDDDEKDARERKKVLYGFAKTAPVPIPTSSVIKQPQSLPKISSDINLIPNYHIRPQTSYESYDSDCVYGDNSHSNPCSSESLP